MKQEKINILLDKNEALILFEFLSRFCGEDKIIIKDNSEKIVLWGLLCILESSLTEPFQEKYNQIIQKARDAINN